MGKQIKDFLLHLRLHYQFFVLAGVYLSGAILAEPKDIFMFVLQFLNIHILLFGGITAYNSYYDKDKGPVGGLKHPPKMVPWMLWASWILQITGLVVAGFAGMRFVIVYLISVLFFWLYSSPRTRWKSKPILSIVAVGFAIGIGTFLMGYLSIGGNQINIRVLVMAFGTTLSFLAIYPISQAYQIGEDKKRGDITFAVKYGLLGIQKLFLVFFPIGVFSSSIVLYYFNINVSRLYFFGGIAMGLYIWFSIADLKMNKDSYDSIMNLKYFSGIAVSLFALAVLIFKIYGSKT